MKKILYQLAIIILLAACQEETEAPTLPSSFELTIPEILEIGLYSAQAEAQITFSEVEEVKNVDFGLVWSTSPGAIPSDSVRQAWSTRGAGIISRSPFPIYDVLLGLDLNTTYYIRPYFVDEKNNLTYGPETTFTTLAGNAWSPVGNNFPGNAGQWPVGFAIGEAIYVGLSLVSEGGNLSVTREWWQFDVATRQWTQKADFPGDLSIDPQAFSVDDKGYIVSSVSEQQVACWEYDPQQDRWTRKTDFPDYGREGNAAFSFGVNGKGYLSGGYGGGYSLQSVWEFDPQDATTGVDEHGNPMGSWTQKNNFPGREHRNAAVFIINDQVYIGLDAETVVGADSLETKKQLWRYDTPNDAWIAEGFFPGEPRELTIAFSANGKGYMGGGRDHTDFWEYDPVIKEWTPRAEASGGDISFSVNNRGYTFSYGMLEYVP
ncbi:MAG: Kelch repeat-containing protein [Cyclobacteriaceae bacterium]